MPFAPSPPEPPHRLRLTTPAQILTAVPYLVGFVPAQSIVVLGLRDKQIAITLRLDLDTPRQILHGLVIERLRDNGATRAVIVVFDPELSADSGAPPGIRLARPLIRAVRNEGLEVVDALGVRGARFWSYLCTNPRCCPPGGRLVPTAGEPDHNWVAAAFVATGKAPLASRGELCASIAPASPQRLAELAPAFEQALAAPEADPLELWSRVVRRYADGPPRRPLPDGQVAQLVISLADVLIRDELISWMAGEKLGSLLEILRGLAPLAPPPFDTQVLASLAWAAYTCGEGALAAVAVDRALDTDPQHNLSRLLSVVLDNGVDPEQLRTVSTDLVADLRQLESQACVRRRDAG